VNVILIFPPALKKNLKLLLLAKVIVHGENRDQAISKMRRALKETQVHGIRTNLKLHKKILEHSSFCRGELSTNALQKWFFSKKLNHF